MFTLLLINLLRITPLTYDTFLSQRATQRAEIVYSNWSHNNWKQSFKDTDCLYQGENLTKDFTNPLEELMALYKSPKHRYNMLNEKYKRIGVGEYKNVNVYLFCN